MPFSINTKETLAVFYAIKSFRSQLANQHVLIKSDNTTAISFIAKMGGMSSELCDKIAVDAWNSILQMNSWLSIAYIPSRDNIDADITSRLLCEHTQWTLETNVFTAITQELGMPDVDAFASHLNNQVKVYYSYTPDPHCTHVDAFVIDWLPELLFYSFPPFSCVGRTIDKLSRDGMTSLLIFPMWTSQHSFLRLLDLLVSPIYIIPGLPIYLPWDHTIQHPLTSSLQMCTAKLSGQFSLILQFHRDLQNCNWNASLPRDCPHLKSILRNGSDIHHKGKQIPIHHLTW